MFEEKEDEKIEEILDEIKKKESEEVPYLETKKKNPPAKLIFTIIMFLMFLFSLAYNANRVVEMNKPILLTEDEKLRSIRNYLYLTSMKIEEFKKEKGKLPETMFDVMIEDTFIGYKTLNDSTFEITCRYDNLFYKYVSTDDAEMLLSDDMTDMLNENGGENE